MVDTREPRKTERATAVFDAVASAGRAALSTQVLGEFADSAVRKVPGMSRERAAAFVSSFATDAEILDVTAAVAFEAVRGSARYRMRYWDAQLWATARLNGIPLILSEDFCDGAVIEGVRFANPFAEGFDLDALLVHR